MGQPIDVTYVELRSRGVDEAARDIRRSLQDIEKDVDDTNREIERSFADASKSIEDDLTQVSRDAGRAADSISESLNGAAQSAAEGFGGLSDAADRTREEMERAFEEAGFQLVTNFDSTTKQLTQRWVKIGEDGKEVFAEIGDSVDDFKEKVDRTTTSTRGLGDTLKDTFDDVDRDFNRTSRSLSERMGDLSDSVVDAVRNIGQSIAGVARSGPVGLLALAAAATAGTGALVAMGGAALDLVGAVGLLPAAGAAAGAVFGALALTFSGVSDAVEALAEGDLEEIEEALEGLSPSARRFARELNALRGPLNSLRTTVQEAFFTEFLGDLTRLSRDLLPTLREGLADVSGALGRFGEQFLSAFRTDEAVAIFQELFNSVARIIESLSPAFTRLAGSLIEALGAGLPFLEQLGDAVANLVTRFADFISESIESGAFQQFLQDAFDTMEDLGELTEAVGRLLVALFGNAGDEGRTFLETLTEVVNQFAEFFESAEGQEAIQEVVDSFLALSSALVTVTGFLTAGAQEFQRFQDSLSATGDSIGGFFESLSTSVQTTIDSITGFFSALPERIGAAVAAIPGVVSGVFTNMFDLVTTAIGFGIGTVLGFFIALPGRIAAATFALPGIIAGIFSRAVSAAVSASSQLVSRTASLLATLPGRAARALASFPSQVLSVLRRSVSGAFDVGLDIMNGVARGISAGVGAVISVARRAARNILDGMKAALDIGSPSRVFADEVGREITAGVSVGVEQGTPDLVSTINGLSRAIVPGVSTVNNGGDATQSVVLSPGAVQVNLMGAATESQARTVGNAVGAGIVDAVTRRQVQLRVRTI